MELIANNLNKKFLKQLFPPADAEVDGVMAAIAYGSNFPNQKDDFIADCIKNKYRLDLWMRYDHTVPVAPTLLWRILSHHKDNIFCKLIPDCLHSKVIWWKGYGVYIGSANLTERAWNSNIEAGLFLTEEELHSNKMMLEIEFFFDELRVVKDAIPLTKEIIEELEKMAALRKGDGDKGKNSRTIPYWEGPNFHDKKPVEVKRKERFRKEWTSTLTHLRSIGEMISKRRPQWIDSETHISWQVDQFLHAYYYNKVGEGLKKPYEEYYAQNKTNPNQAVLNVINWWESTTAAPSDENITLGSKAPLIHDYLSKGKILTLNVEQFAEVCSATHATSDHIVKMRLSTLDVNGISTLKADERIQVFSPWLMKKRNKIGWNILELLNNVLYGGEDQNMWERIYRASKDKNYAFPHFGLNSIAELAGWARPEVAPPRNGRTSKALRALGFDVHVY